MKEGPFFYNLLISQLINQNSFLQKEQQNKKCCQACFLPIGSHTFCCGTDNTKKDFKQFGMGINLYFRFLKKLGHFFIIFTILSIPQLFFSVLAYVGSESRDSTDSFQFLMATTIGATSLNNKDCQIQVYSVTEFPDDQIEFNLQCDSGNLAGSSFYYGIINSNEQDCIYLGKSELNLNSTNQDRLNSLRQQINSKEEFSFTLRKSDFVNEDPTGKRIYAGAYCKESTITIGSLELKQKIIPIIFASCDAVIVLLFIYFLISLTASENKYSKLSQKETPTLQHFSIQLSKLPKIEKLIKFSKNNDEFDRKKDLLLFEVKQFINEQLKLVLNDQQLQIYDIQISENEELLQLQIQIKQRKLKIQEQLDKLKFIDTDIFKDALSKVIEQDKNLTQTLYKQFYQNFRNLLQNPNKEQKIDQPNRLIVKYWKEIDEINQKIDKIQLDENSKYIWVTFDTINQKEMVQKKLQSLPKDWLYYYTCLKCFDDREEQEKFLLKKFKLQVKDAPIPENINWKNLNYSMKQRFFRQLISMLFTLILLACSWVLVSWVNLQKSDFQEKYPSINCNNKIYDNITIEQVQQEIDNDNNSAIKGYVECYCKPKFSEIIQGEYEICQDWGKQYAFQQSLPWIIVAGLIAINVLIQYILIFLSKWEAHLMISEEYSSRILKIFLAQFLNTGLILLISNIDFGNSTRNDAPKTVRFLFGGKYGDIDSKWCQNIGIVLLLTLLINILTQPIMLMVEIIIRYVRKAYDQCSCCLNEKKTRQQNYQDFKDLYKGEEFRVELRYAQILTALYICVMYSPALPFLYFITMLTVWFLYFVDKISIFNTYRKPIRIDSIISESVRKYLWIAVVIHLSFATYIYGSSNLFYETVEAEIVIDQLQNVYGQENVVVEWWDRSWSQIPNVILLVILALIVILIILFFFCYKPIVGLFSKCFGCCNEEILQNNPGLDQYEQRPLLKFLKKEQIVDDLQFTLQQKDGNPKIYDDKYLKLEAECIQLYGSMGRVPFGINREYRQDQSQNISRQPAVNNNGNQSQIAQINNNNANQNGDAKNQINNQAQEENHQKLIGLRSFNKAYNKTYKQYYEWEFIRSIKVDVQQR
ncbi:unnamed protein product (macronuclear) [Paramecium tetraurelia]|uniref:Anoctamin transmembrane domain-containing protein n=1 Tax=Paramecium tetraurelia TaxID=5888 RepID=A0DMA3_PARTE|nr:uncharacterized protein GSPATT00018388001 [Paramecium tetraurelia]CAK84170.1 unnamed protein product [Paramecium tetraurelia]|eukprot:XP_001451567.1 hypothetical protein (macronuclear) [Paramecium tetraurelia strain d4-2]